tara:strand:- start:11509 stop:12435 length:927 start_codon:yes stop_codon:yes gene_type:complete
MSILVIAEHDNTSIRPSTLNTIAAAKLLGDDIHLFVATNNSELANSASTIENISKVIASVDDTLQHQLPEALAPMIKEIAISYSHVLTPATTFGKNLMPRASALLDSQQISDISGVIDQDTFKRPIYAGSCIATVKSNDSVKLITVRATAFDPVQLSGGSAVVESFDSVVSNDKSEFVSEEIAKSDRPELTAADVIISGGRGMQSGDNFHLLETIADKLGAAVGASRAAVDAGFVPNDYQVGQTGKIVAPNLYIAVGISGAIQHLAGMKDSKVIVAINKDEDAPIFQVADYGLVADLFNALPELADKI